MANSPFTPAVTPKIAQQRIMARRPAPALRDGPTPERFKAIKRHWNDTFGNNDGYDLWDLSGEKTTFDGEQPLLDAYFADNPLPQGAHGVPRQIDLFVHWGHDNKHQHIITEIQPVPVPPAPPSEATIERLKHDEHVQTHQGVSMTDNPVLNEAFPRTDDDQPADDEGLALADYLTKKAAEPPSNGLKALADKAKEKRPAKSDWVADNDKLGKFWGKIHKLELEFGWEPKDVEALVYKCAGVDSLHEYVGTANDLFLAVNKAMLDKQTPPENENAQNSPNEAIGEAQVKPEATTPETQNKPAADVPASVESGKENQLDKTQSNPMSEAAYVVLLSLYAPYGAELKFTIRAMTADELAARLDALVTTFTKRGYKMQRDSQPAPVVSAPTVAPAPVAAPAPTPAQPVQTGTVRIGAVKKVMDEGKTRYELYASTQDEKPLLVVRLESIVQQTIGQHIDVNQMQPGTRYTVAWDADWKLGKLNPKNNMQFKDLTAVRAIAAPQVA